MTNPRVLLVFFTSSPPNNPRPVQQFFADDWPAITARRYVATGGAV